MKTAEKSIWERLSDGDPVSMTELGYAEVIAELRRCESLNFKLSQLPPVNPYEDESRGLGAADMAEAILTGKMPRASKELEAHVLDVLSALKESSEKGCLISVGSDAERPEPLRGSVESIQRD